MPAVLPPQLRRVRGTTLGASAGLRMYASEVQNRTTVLLEDALRVAS